MIYRVPVSKSVSEQRAATIFYEHDCAAPEHEHADAQVSILFKGERAKFISHGWSGKTTRTGIAPHSFIYIAPGQPHRTHWNGDGKLLNLYFPEAWLQERGEEMGCSLSALRPFAASDGSIHEIGRLLLDEFTWEGQLLPTTVDHATTLVAHRLLRLSKRLSGGEIVGLLSQSRLQPAIDFIDAHPEEQFLMEDLARMCNSSVFHFARSFSARLQCAPFAYQRKRRLEKARQLLIETELPIQVVGCEVGLENPPNFSRLFRRETGISPGALRRLHQKQKP